MDDRVGGTLVTFGVVSIGFYFFLKFYFKHTAIGTHLITSYVGNKNTSTNDNGDSDSDTKNNMFIIFLISMKGFLNCLNEIRAPQNTF